MSKKRTVALMLALLLIITAFPAKFSAKAETAVYGEAAVMQTETPLEPGTDSEEVVAEVSLCSCMYSFPFVGHTWIYVKNLSGEAQKVGLYDLPVGQGVSVGTFAFSAHDGWGIYYNLEAYRENRDNNLQNHWAVTKSLTQSELNSLSDSIANYANYWDFYFNCAFFSFSIWNGASNSFLIPLVIPAISQLEIMLAGGKKGQLEMYKPDPSQVYRQSGTGASSSLIPVSEKTLNS